MKTETEKIILSDSPEAARLVHLNLPDGEVCGKGWVSVNRRFFTAEAQARNDSATHHKCETCGEINKRGDYCRPCYAKKSTEKYMKMPFMEWDEKDCVVIFQDDRFFNDKDEVLEYCEDNDIKPEDLMLVICEPNRLSTIDSSHWADIMPDDGDGELPQAVEDAITALNNVLEKQPPISWSAGIYRTTVTTNPTHQ